MFSNLKNIAGFKERSRRANQSVKLAKKDGENKEKITALCTTPG